MNEQPLDKALSVWTDGNEPLLVKITLDGAPQPWDTFTGFELIVADSPSDATADLVAEVTPQNGGLLQVIFDESALKVLLPFNADQDKRRMQYVLRAKPIGTYRVRLMYGQFTINKGLPEATV